MGEHCKEACGLCKNPTKLLDCPCEDENESCSKLADEGACCTNSSYMLQHCRKSCGQCGNQRKAPECTDSEKWCSSFPQHCDNATYQDEMKKCGKTCSQQYKRNMINIPPSMKMFNNPTGVQMQLIQAGRGIAARTRNTLDV